MKPRTLTDMRARRQALMAAEQMGSLEIMELCELDAKIRDIETSAVAADQRAESDDEHATHLGCGAV